MRIRRDLMIVFALAILALVLVAGAMAAVAAIDSASNSNALLSPAFSAKVTFGYTILLGTLPVLFVGAPGYLILLRRNLARWYYVVALGIAPGLAAMPFDANLAFWAVICGAAVALATHIAYRRLGPNNSFKPKPLRGSA
jgi:hypothetical protein